MYSVDNALATVTDLIEGVYEFELKTLKANDVSKRDTMKVIVTSSPITSTDALTADAGRDQKIVLPNNTVNLSGTGTGSIIAFQWRQLNGPSIAMHSIDNAAATVNNLVEGVYQFELKVLTANDISRRDTMEVTVMSPAASGSPDLVVDAGPDQTITLPTNTATLSGAGRGANIAFQWRQLSGPSKVMYSVDNAWTQVTGLIQGNYQFELKVVNTNDISVRDTMQVTVNVSNTTFASKASSANTSTPGVSLGDKEAFESISAPQQKTAVPRSGDLKIFPNPVEDETTLQINITEPSSDVVIQISDMKGTTVYKKQLTAAAGLLTEKINMSNYTDGTYSITVIVNSVERQTIQALKL